VLFANVTKIGTVQPFAEPVYVTRPILPPLEKMSALLGEVWEAGWLTNSGMQQKALEQRLQNFLAVPHLSLFSSGTTALMVAIRALGISGEVITTPFTFPATPHALFWNNLPVVFADVDPDSMNLAPEAIEAAVGPNTAAILPVHVFGTPCDWEAIEDIAARHNLRVIYDAAHAFGTEIGSVPVGALGDVSMFSFHATKTFHTAEGGALSTKDPELKARFDLLRNFGIQDETTVSMPGLNGKMNELQAALGLLVLDMLKEEQGKRAVLKRIYEQWFKPVDGIHLVSDRPGVKGSYQYVAIRIDKERFGRSRDEVYDRLREHNVIARKYFAPLCSELPHFKMLQSASAANLPVANRVASEILCLPVYGALPPESVEKICEIIVGAN